MDIYMLLKDIAKYIQDLKRHMSTSVIFRDQKGLARDRIQTDVCKEGGSADMQGEKEW